MIRHRSGTTSRLALVFLASLVWLCPAPARADDDATVVARERFKEGVQYFDQKQYDKARVAFLQAYALKKHPSVLLNLAHSELQSGHEAEAAKHFAMYLREAKNPTDAEKKGAEDGLLAAKAVVGEVEIEVEAEGADVYIDGTLEGRSPLPGPAFVDPGTHTIEAKKDGRTASAQITASAGQATSASLRFEVKRAPSAARPDGDQPSEDSAQDADVASSGGRKPFFKWVGETPPAWVGVGLTAAGVIGGVGFAVAAKSSYDSADSIAAQITDQANEDKVRNPSQPNEGICTNPQSWLVGAMFDGNHNVRTAEYRDACQKFTDNQSNGDTMKMVSIVSWAVAGAAAAGTVIYYFVDSGKPREQAAKSGLRVGVHPILTPWDRGLGIVGSF